MKLAFLALIFGQCQGRRLQIRAPIDDAGCEGRLDLPKFAKVNQVCEECYSLYKEIDVYKLCRYLCTRDKDPNVMGLFFYEAFFKKDKEQWAITNANSLINTDLSQIHLPFSEWS